MLKPLDRALRDGNTIRAIVRGTGSNQDGKTPGITFPSKGAQIALAERVYRQAGLDPLHTTYVECHGTGTQGKIYIHKMKSIPWRFSRASGEEMRYQRRMTT